MTALVLVRVTSLQNLTYGNSKLSLIYQQYDGIWPQSKQASRWELDNIVTQTEGKNVSQRLRFVSLQVYMLYYYVLSFILLLYTIILL